MAEDIVSIFDKVIDLGTTTKLDKPCDHCGRDIDVGAPWQWMKVPLYFATSDGGRERDVEKGMVYVLACCDVCAEAAWFNITHPQQEYVESVNEIS